MVQTKAATVSDYVSSLPPDRQRVVKQVRGFLKNHLPKGYKEQMGFGAITYAVPLAVLPDTYNGQPLCYLAIAAQKNYYTLYLMNVYGNARQKAWMAGVDMGKSCLHFTSLDDLPLDVVGEVIASTPMERYVAQYREARKNTAKGR